MNSRILGLDVARATAILLVVVNHSHQQLQAIGIYGVELFFALSGFLIGGILYRSVPNQGHWSLLGVANFWQRRWWRTLPNYYLFLIVAIFFYHTRGEWPKGGWDGILPYFLFLPNLMQPNEAFFDVSWSLCVEEGFYFLFPLVILLLNRLIPSRNRVFVLTILLFIIVAPLLRELVMSAWPAPQVRVTTLPRLDAICYGVAVVAWMQAKGISRSARFALFMIGAMMVAGVASAHWVLRPADEAKWFYRIALVAMPLGFSLCMPLLSTWAKAPVWANWIAKPITAISLWSYSLYLCHHMIILGVLPWFGEDRESLKVKLLSKIVGVALSILVSWLVFRFFETPLTRKRPPEFKGESGKAIEETERFAIRA